MAIFDFDDKEDIAERYDSRKHKRKTHNHNKAAHGLDPETSQADDDESFITDSFDSEEEMAIRRKRIEKRRHKQYRITSQLSRLHNLKRNPKTGNWQ